MQAYVRPLATDSGGGLPLRRATALPFRWCDIRCYQTPARSLGAVRLSGISLVKMLYSYQLYMRFSESFIINIGDSETSDSEEDSDASDVEELAAPFRELSDEYRALPQLQEPVA
ncbi:hypothetical protein J6590_033654 [Homalodisca vitripennis]|nr:hypothetical protein J6590_033654 [Homalodisca vitripennis]